MNHACQLGHRVPPELGRDMGAMQLHRALLEAQVGGDLLVEFAGHSLPEDFGFALGQQREGLAQGRHARALRPIRFVASQGAVHGGNQLLFGGVLGQEVLRPEAFTNDCLPLTSFATGTVK